MKRIVITGCEGLIGSSIKKYLTSKNYDCLGLDIQLGHDLSDEEFVKDYFKNNSCDGLVNLFALNHHIDSNQAKNTLFDVSLSSFEEYLKINLTSLFSVCREYARNNKKGSIINFSSTYGVVSPIKNMYIDEEKHIGYSVSKSGVIMLTKHLATHLSPNIRVNTVIPGGVYNKQSKDFVERYSRLTPMSRMMNVEELNGIVEYLLSDSSTYVTGTELKIEGGWTAW
jgi:NAD(P)-dependent dehydrogenase (short-subunit alcohol dehydrogenase family)